MEKLICSACGAPLTPNTSEPFLTCEYCDTTVNNKYYVEPEAETVQTAETLADEAIDEAGESSGGGLLKTLLGVGTAIAASSALRRSRTIVQRRTPLTSSAPRTPKRAVHIAPHRHPEPPRTGSFGARPARPAQGGMNRPQSGFGRTAGRSMGGRGMGGPGGRSGRGGRHR